jgi:hypothetical protein
MVHEFTFTVYRLLFVCSFELLDRYYGVTCYYTIYGRYYKQITQKNSKQKTGNSKSYKLFLRLKIQLS